MQYFPVTNSRLIAALQDPTCQMEWAEFVRIYEPALLSWLQRRGLRAADAQDCSQRVLVQLVQSLGMFRPDGEPAAFRRWLHRVARNEVVSFLRQESRHGTPESSVMAQLAARQLERQTSHSDAIELEYRRHIFRVAAAVVETQVAPRHWQAFWRTMVLQEPTPLVAQELTMSVGAVYVTKGRVLKLLQAQITELELPL